MIATKRKYAEIDTRHYPIVIATLQAFEPTVTEFQEHLDELSYIIKTHQHFVMILDISQSKFLPSEMRIMAGNWLKQEAGMMRKNMRGMVMLNNSMVMGMILKGVLLISRPSVDYLVANSKEEAITWATRLLSTQTKL